MALALLRASLEARGDKAYLRAIEIRDETCLIAIPSEPQLESVPAERLRWLGSSARCRYGHRVMFGPAYSSDLTDAEWHAIGPLLREPAFDGPALVDLRYVINGVLFLLRLRAEIRTKPPWSTAEAYYAQWQADGTWKKIVATLLTTRPANRLDGDPARQWVEELREKS